MQLRSGRNEPDWHRVSGQNVRALAGLHGHSNLEPDRMQDVALLAVGIVQQRQARRAVRIVFDGRNPRRDSFFLTAEINRAVLFLVSAAAMPDRDFAMGVASAGAFLRLDQGLLRRLLGDLALVEHGHEAPRCCVRVKAFQCHNALFSSGTPRGPPPEAAGAAKAETPGYRLSAYSIIFSPAANFT